MASTTKFLGVTPPVTVAGPTDKEKKLTESLVAELHRQGMFESPAESRLREVVLGKLDELVKEFVYKGSLEKGLSDSLARAAGGKIFTFGSYRLGVHGPGSDIDTLCVVPKHIQREDFFRLFYQLLLARPEATDITPVPEAFVPVINCKFSGIKIDFTFARLALSRVDDSLILEDSNLLRNLDDRDVRSLGGSRVTDDILRLVPDVTTFHIALRTIKLWAQRKAIYSNVLGFLGGVAWAMLTARICQLYPNATASTIVGRFFVIYTQWIWPNPVLLRQIEEGPLQVRVWNPKLYHGDRNHRMPIITPAYPSMCATHNVSRSTQTIMTEAFKEGDEMYKRIADGTTEWVELFSKGDFFTRYKNYLMITASSNSADTQLKWEGTVESKLRQLIMRLEMDPHIEIAHPYVKGFEKAYKVVNDEERDQVSRGIVTQAVEERSKEVPDAAAEAEAKNEEKTEEKTDENTEEQPQFAAQESKGPTETKWTTNFFIGLAIKPKDPTKPEERRSLNLFYPTQFFTDTVKQWEQYDPEASAISVRHIKSSELPLYVFENGERPKKKKRSRASGEADGGRAKKAKTNGTTQELASAAAAAVHPS